MESAAAKIVDLRQLLAERFPTAARPARQTCATGLAGLDETLGGGLPLGALTEIVRPAAGAGAGLLLHALVEQAALRRSRLALVDGRDAFDPDDFDNATLRALLWVRCRSADMAVKAADWLLRDGNLPLAVLDLTLNPPAELRRIPISTWHRLARAAEARGLACLALTPQPLVASAVARLELVHRFALPALAERRGQLTAALCWHWLRRREALSPESGKVVAFAAA
ncbi:MAG: hypothetical protein JSR82_12720 [Verrucomicrobia bacterium]|nr:hypothetical protein [Verrucomicrobiota bacterium]